MNWFNKLKDYQKKYIENHPEPYHLVFYLKLGFSFEKALMRGYEEYASEETEKKINNELSNNELSNKPQP